MITPQPPTRPGRTRARAGLRPTSCTSPAPCARPGCRSGRAGCWRRCGRSRRWGSAAGPTLYWTLHAVFVNRRDQRELFDQCFHIFWRDPQLLERMMHLLLPQLEAGEPAGRQEEVSRRRRRGAGAARSGPARTRRGGGAAGSSSMRCSPSPPASCCRRKDFEQMSAEEVGAGAARDRTPAAADHAGADPALQAATRAAGGSTCGARCASRCAAAAASIDLARKERRRRRHPPLVILCDISGSMSRYSRMLLLFMHAITNDRDRVHELPVRHPADQRHPPAAQPRHRPGAGADRRAGAGLGGRHPDRRLPEGVQPGLVAPRARPGGGGAADQRRARPRRRRGPGRARWSGCTRAAAG